MNLENEHFDFFFHFKGKNKNVLKIQNQTQKFSMGEWYLVRFLVQKQDLKWYVFSKKKHE